MERRERVECEPFGVGEPAVEERDRCLQHRHIGLSYAGASNEEGELGKGGVEVVAVPVSQR